MKSNTATQSLKQVDLIKINEKIPLLRLRVTHCSAIPTLSGQPA